MNFEPEEGPVVGYIKQVPWTGVTNSSNDYAMANIGQVKNLFSFDVTYRGDTASPLPYWWQIHYFGATGQKPDTSTPSGDGKPSSKPSSRESIQKNSRKKFLLSRMPLNSGITASHWQQTLVPSFEAAIASAGQVP